MKKILFTIVFIFMVGGLYAQAPHKFNYQAVLRDGTGIIITNTTVLMEIALFQGSPSGTLVFSETHSAATNNFGLVNLQIGGGTITYGIIDTIDWASGPYYVRISVDGTVFGSSQLLSVPYALYAERSFATISNIIKLTINLDVPNIGPTTSSLQKLAVPDAVVGSSVIITPQNALNDGMVISYARVSAADTVEFKLRNTSFAGINLPAMDWYITVIE